jgi:hypothetical protein
MYLYKNLLLVFSLLSIISCGDTATETVKPADAPAETGVQYAVESFRNIQQLLTTYYSLKDALVTSDSVISKEAAIKVASALDSLQMQADSSLKLSSLTYPAIIKEASLNLSKTSSLEEQRAIFETISDNLYEFIHSLRPAGIETYKQYCPMAFNDKGAFWLSDTSHIQNPYFGKKMLICGEVQEELRYH